MRQKNRSMPGSHPVATHVYHEFAGQDLPDINANGLDGNVDRAYKELNFVRVFKAWRMNA